MQDPTTPRATLRVLPPPAVDEPLVALPTGALADLPLPVIVGAYHSALQRLENAACGVTRRPAAEDVHDTVIALQAARVVADRLACDRWPTVRDGLAQGATIADLAAAAGVGEVELVVEVGAWADRELQASRMERDEHERTIELIGTAVAVERRRLRRPPCRRPDAEPAGRAHLAYTEPHATHGTWTSPPRCLPDRAAALDARDNLNTLAGPDARARRTWQITPCDCRNGAR